MTDTRESQDTGAEGLASSEVTAQRIVVRDFLASAFIGVTDDERAKPQRLSLQVELELQVRPPQHDDISEVLSYGRVVALLREISARRDFHLLESLAETLADALFRFEQVTASTIRVEKLERYADVMAVGIEITRQRLR